MRAAVLALSLGLVSAARAAHAEEWKVTVNLKAFADTWATHDDGTVHGAEKGIKVGQEPQGCQTGILGYDPCPKAGLTCCIAQDGYNYCAADGACETTTPQWEAFRKFRGYIRFDLSAVPKGTVLKATLRLRQSEVVEDLGGPAKVVVTRLKAIGNAICAWDEATLNDTNLTTWSSLPQNVAKSPDGVWAYDVTKAAADWLTGNVDLKDAPIEPNCGFHLYDPDFGKTDQPLKRWVVFQSKEGGTGPELSLVIAKDLDGDGFTGDVDCDETDNTINPAATEVCDGVDNDCDGLVDNEICDFVDNDCDGATDEGTNAELCGPGTVCIAGKCMKSCEDVCKSSYDLSCRETDGKWQVLHCQNGDDDPCLEWVPVEECPAGWYCVWGSCSSNCLDDFDPDCDVVGKKACVKDKAGNWAVSTCGQYDSDPCLEWGDAQPCGKGADCKDAKCGPPCEDACEVGDRKCAGEGEAAVLYCHEFDADGCWEWGGKAQCGAGATCEDGVCVGACADECGKAGDVRCGTGVAGVGVDTCGQHDLDDCLEWGAFQPCVSGKCEAGKCVAPCVDECPAAGKTECGDAYSVRTCGNTDPDPCLEWGEPQACPLGCEDGACVAGEDVAVVTDSGIPVPDAASMDPGAMDAGVDVGTEMASDTGAGPDSGPAWQDVSVSVDGKTGTGGSSSGGCSPVSNPSAAWLVGVLLAVVVGIGRRRGDPR